MFMKTIKILSLIGLALIFVHCDSDDAPQEQAVFAIPVVMSMDEIRNNVSVVAAQETDSEGKIYVAENRLFYIAKEAGVHVFNNQNPESPQNSAFINIPGVHDIAIKGNYLYADNYIDMLVFDISDMAHITLVQTLQNVVNFYLAYPETAEFYDYSEEVGANEFIVGFRLEHRNRPVTYTGGDILTANEANGMNTDAGNVGTGGSYAKFQINNNALYAIDNYQLNVYNITNPTHAFFDKVVYLNQWIGGGQFETLFKQKEFLFVGATNGMHVVNAADEFNPYFVSSFNHATACDPVVVYGATAYITVRGGTSCGAIQDQVNVLDVSDMANPILKSTYLLNQPYGIGIKNARLYVCCGAEGLKIFNALNDSQLILENSYAGHFTDVIPMDSHLIAVGNNKIIQYAYGENYTLQQLSVLNF